MATVLCGVSANEVFCAYVAAVLQTTRGQISAWNFVLLWPYHVGLRSKLWIQRRASTEPHWTLITDGW